MRITCPNCSAQYEVDAAMIPASGRDVQCSNCAHTWFQERAPEAAPKVGAPPRRPFAASEPELAETEDDFAEDLTAAEPSAEKKHADIGETSEVEEAAEAEIEPERAPETSAEAPIAAESVIEEEPKPAASAEEVPGDNDSPEGELADEEPATLSAEIASEPEFGSYAAAETPAVDDASEAAAPKTSPTPESQPAPAPVAATMAAALSRHVSPDAEPRRPRPDMLGILREEAEREVGARRAEAAPIETQPDLGLREAAEPRGLRAKLARLRGEPAPEPAEDEAEPRRNLLPDIEQINSSLRPSEAHIAPPPEAVAAMEAERRRGFRVGFASVVGLSVLLVALYAYAPALIRIMPSAGPAIIGYVEAANGLRDGIDGLLSGLTGKVSG